MTFFKEKIGTKTKNSPQSRGGETPLSVEHVIEYFSRVKISEDYVFHRKYSITI
jgi:hypothetical protein